MNLEVKKKYTLIEREQASSCSRTVWQTSPCSSLSHVSLPWWHYKPNVLHSMWESMSPLFIDEGKSSAEDLLSLRPVPSMR